jgi:hypothetical protein
MEPQVDDLGAVEHGDLRTIASNASQARVRRLATGTARRGGARQRDGAELAPRWTALLPAGYEATAIFADERVLFTRGFPRAAG